jgi:hypothetical protein
MKCCTPFLILLMLALCGCSKPMPSHPPAEFSQRLSRADRLEATNVYYAMGFTNAGADTTNLANAIKAATEKTWGTSCDWMSPRIWKVTFFSGTNELAVVPIGYGLFNLNGVEFGDPSRVVESFWKRLDELGTQ